jgi:hypothetical protein
MCWLSLVVVVGGRYLPTLAAVLVVAALVARLSLSMPSVSEMRYRLRLALVAQA